VTSDAGVWKARQVIVATPPLLAAEISSTPLLPPLLDAMRRRMTLGTLMKIHAVCPEPFWRKDPGVWMALKIGGVVPELFDNTPPEGTPCVLMGFHGGHSWRQYAHDPGRPPTGRAERLRSGVRARLPEPDRLLRAGLDLGAAVSGRDSSNAQRDARSSRSPPPASSPDSYGRSPKSSNHNPNTLFIPSAGSVAARHARGTRESAMGNQAPRAVPDMSASGDADARAESAARGPRPRTIAAELTRPIASAQLGGHGSDTCHVRRDRFHAHQQLRPMLGAP
jgi:hypothetical protein